MIACLTFNISLSFYSNSWAQNSRNRYRSTTSWASPIFEQHFSSLQIQVSFEQSLRLPELPLRHPKVVPRRRNKMLFKRQLLMLGCPQLVNQPTQPSWR